MNVFLQIKMIVLAIVFFIFITYFVKKKKLHVKQSLIWYLASLVLIMVSISPKCLYIVSGWFGIMEATNSMFLIVIAFLLLIVFLNNITISKHQESITLLIQEISILKSRLGGNANENISVCDSTVNNACDGTDTLEN